MENFEHIRTKFEKALPPDLYSWSYEIPEETLTKAVEVLINLPKESTQVIIDPGTDGCCAAIVLSSIIDVKGTTLRSIKEVLKKPEVLEEKTNVFLDIAFANISALVPEEDLPNCIIINHHDIEIDAPVKLFLSMEGVCTSQLLYDVVTHYNKSLITDQLKLFTICGALSDTTEIKGPVLNTYKELSNKIYTSKSFCKFCNKLVNYKGPIRIEEDISPIFNRVSRMTPNTDLYAVPLFVNKVLRLMNRSVYAVDASQTFVAALQLPEKCEYISIINEKVAQLNKEYNNLARSIEAEQVSTSGVPIFLITPEKLSITEHQYDILTNCVGAVMSTVMSKNGTNLIVLFKLSDGTYKGVMRDYQSTDLHKHISVGCLEEGILLPDIGGNRTAMGFRIADDEKYEEFLDYMSDVSLQRMPKYSKDVYYNSAIVPIPNDMVRADIFGMMSEYKDIPRRYIPQLLLNVFIPEDAKVGINRIKRDDYVFKILITDEELLSKIRGKEVPVVWHFPGKVSILSKNFEK